MVSIEGENMRGVTWCVIEEVKSGDWAIGGQRLTTEAVLALAAGHPPSPMPIAAVVRPPAVFGQLPIDELDISSVLYQPTVIRGVMDRIDRRRHALLTGLT